MANLCSSIGLSVASDSTELVDKTASQVYIKEQNLFNMTETGIYRRVIVLGEVSMLGYIWFGGYTRVLFSDKVGSSGHFKHFPLYIC